MLRSVPLCSALFRFVPLCFALFRFASLCFALIRFDCYDFKDHFDIFVHMLNTIAIINLIIAIQSLFLAIHFGLKTKGIDLLNRIMAVMTFCFAIMIFNTYYSLSDFPRSDFLQDLANNVMWFVGPSMYLYVIYKTEHFVEDKLKRHFLPYLIPAIFDLSFDYRWYDDIIPFIGLTQMLIYMFASIRVAYQDFQERRSYISWVLPLILVFTFLILFNFVMQIATNAELFSMSTSLRQSLTTIFIIPIFYLSYKEMNAEKDFDLVQEKYKTSQLSDDKTTLYLKQIEDYLVGQKHYLQPSLTLADISNATSIPTKYISQVINQTKKQRFTDYLLDLRINEAKRRLRDNQSAHLSIAGIAEECGFASSSRFNHHFKRMVGMTPSDFRHSHLP